MSIERIKYGDRTDWLQLRREGIGGSEAGIIMGVSEYGSELTLWSEKLGMIKDQEANLAMKMGNYLEPLVAAEFQERTGKRVQERHYMMRNSKYPFALGNIDRRVVGENALLECKTTGSIPRIRAFRMGEYPDSWYCQCQHYMAVGEFDRAYLACINRNMQGEYIDWVIPRDDEFIREMMDREEIFWEKVQRKTPPDPNGNEREREVLSALYSADVDKSVDVSAMLDRIKAYKEYAELEKKYRQLKDETKNTICMLMGDATVGLIGGEKVCTWKEIHKAAYMVKESVSRQFRLSK